ncbi:MAG: type III-B CRISPR module RAMP protein Cmr6, partial [Rhodocyclaceae bacterium]|nr:type III-B CRISPR module RAMP protein Cmr6 [Rhodocyclaceae bacterium]
MPGNERNGAEALTYFAPSRPTIEALKASSGARANLGLVWERNLNVFPDPGESGGAPALKQANVKQVLKEFISQYAAAATEGSRALALRAARLAAALEQCSRVDTRHRHARLQFRLEWRLATGLGAAHPTENGCAFDTLTGAPCLNGSAVKGLCRQTAERWSDLGAAEVERLFGPARIGAANSGFQGELRFFDALPTRWPELQMDVINRHHDACYDGDGKGRVLPRETDNPVPVYFLTVAPRTHFEF